MQNPLAPLVLNALGRRCRKAPALIGSIALMLASSASLAGGDPLSAAPGAATPPPSTTSSAPAPAPALLATIPFTVESGLVVVPVSLNGSPPLRFVLDTGMPDGVLLFDTATAQGLELDWIGTAKVNGGDGGDAIPAQVAMNGRVTIGGLALERERVIAMTVRPTIVDRRLDGVIGASVFKTWIVSIDPRDRTVQLVDPARFEPPAGSESLPLRVVRSLPHVRAIVVTRDGAERHVELLLDTGKTGALALEPDDERPWVMPPDAVQGLLSSSVSSDMHGAWARVATLKLGTLALPAVIAEFPDRATREGDPGDGGVLGLTVLRRFRTTIDYPGARLLLEPTAEFGAPFEMNMAGLVLRDQDGSSLHALVVRPGTPAERAGIKAGDRIVSIDGVPVDTLDRLEIDRQFQRHGAEILLEVRRDAEAHTFSVRLERPL